MLPTDEVVFLMQSSPSEYFHVLCVMKGAVLMANSDKDAFRALERVVLGACWAFLGKHGNEKAEACFRIFLPMGVRALAEQDHSFFEEQSSDDECGWQELLRPIREGTLDPQLRTKLLLQLLALITLHPCFNPTQES